jgi:small subunit ribosomal protein S7
MISGNKQKAFKIFYNALDLVKKNENIDDDPLIVWKKSLSNIMPEVEVRSRRVGGATFQIPMQVRPDRKVSMGMSWLIGFSRKRNGKTMAEKLAAEIVAGFNEEGGAYKKKTEVHKMAESNKAFSHFKI